MKEPVDGRSQVEGAGQRGRRVVGPLGRRAQERLALADGEDADVLPPGDEIGVGAKEVVGVIGGRVFDRVREIEAEAVAQETGKARGEPPAT